MSMSCASPTGGMSVVTIDPLADPSPAPEDHATRCRAAPLDSGADGHSPAPPVADPESTNHAARPAESRDLEPAAGVTGTGQVEGQALSDPDGGPPGAVTRSPAAVATDIIPETVMPQADNSSVVPD